MPICMGVTFLYISEKRKRWYFWFGLIKQAFLRRVLLQWAEGDRGYQPQSPTTSSWIPRHICLNVSATLICPPHERHGDENTWIEKTTQSSKALMILLTWPPLFHATGFHLLIILQHGLHLRTSCDVLRFTRTPRVIITRWPCQAPAPLPPHLLLLRWGFLEFLREDGCPLGSVLVYGGCREYGCVWGVGGVVNDHLLREQPF